PRNIFLSTSVIDAMLRYDMVQSPVSEEQATTEMAELLQGPDSPEARANAYHVVGRIFEEIYLDAYYSAFRTLESNDRVKLLTMAALGASDDGWNADWILKELLQEGG